MNRFYWNGLKTSCILLGVLVIWFIALFSGSAAGLENDQKILFRQAQDTFNKAQSLNGNDRRITMMKAAAQFQVLVDEYGIENGYLYYNIGNAYYGAGKKGKAILNYRRAQQLIPGFRDLQYNLNLTRSEIKGPKEVTGWWEEVVKSLLFWHYMLDFTTRQWLTVIAFVSIWVLLIATLFFRSVFLKFGIVLSILMTFGMGGSFLFSLYQMKMVSLGVTVEEQTTARKGPGIAYEAFYQQPLPEGTEFRVIEKQGEWWKIKLMNNDVAWILSTRAEII